MPLFPPRRVTALDAELCALGDVIRGASRELAEVRGRQAELVDMEAALIVTIEVRMRRVDDLLDQWRGAAGLRDAGAQGPAYERPGAGPRSAGAPDAPEPASGQIPTSG